MKKLSFSNAFGMRTRLKRVLFLWVNFIAGITHAQIYTIKVTPQEIDQLLDFKEPIQIPTIELDGLSEADVMRLKEEDAKAAKAGNPPRVAVRQRRHISTSEQGVWTEAHGQKLWLLEIKSKNATLLSPLFDHLELGAAASIWIFTADKKMLMGPITRKNIPQKLPLVTPDFLPTDAITIAYFTDEAVPLTISGTNNGYHPLAGGQGFGESAECNVDVADPVADCFKFEQNAVAVLLNDDDHTTAQCTGTLINSALNSNQEIRPFLLSAAHCFEGPLTNPSTMRVRFRWQTGMTIRRLVGWWPFRTEVFEGHITFIGAKPRAKSRVKADFALLELFNSPVGTQVTYLGWDKANADPQNMTVLHHPLGDLMKITRDADPLRRATLQEDDVLGDNAWIGTLTRSTSDVGVMQGGSSGSAWLNPNHLVCGTTSLGENKTEFELCERNATQIVTAGRFDVSVDGEGSSDNRLSDWIDPNNSIRSIGGTFKLSAPNSISCTNNLVISAPNLRTSDGTPYSYRWTKSTNLELSGSGNEVVIKATSIRSAGSVEFIECEIIAPSKCNGKELVVGKARHQLVWGLNFSVRNMSTGSESTISFVSLNRSYTYRVFVEGGGNLINASWSVSGASGVAHFFPGQDFLDLNFFNRGSVQVTLTAQFGACSTTKTFVVVGGGFAPQKQDVDLDVTKIYPNPATTQEVVVELPRTIDLQQSVHIELKDISGRTIRTYEVKEYNALLNIQNIPNGVYMVFIQTGAYSTTKKLTIQH